MYRFNPLSSAQLRDAVYTSISSRYDVPKGFFVDVWSDLEKQGVIEQFLKKLDEKKKPEDELDRVVTEAEIPLPMSHVEKVHYEEIDYGLKDKSLDELEEMLGKDLRLNNAVCLEMIKRPNFNRELVVTYYNGLGVEIEMGAEGTYGKGILLKRELTKQQFFTHQLVSKVIAKMLYIPQHARVYDPTCGSGRLFEYMPNHTLCHGVELEDNAYTIARALYPEAQIVNDDTMLHMHIEEFNYIVGNPPFTMSFKDDAFLFKFAGFQNSMFSEVAVMEIAVRSVKNDGYVAMIMPKNVFLEKFQEKAKFMKYFIRHLRPIAKIDLPKKTHAGTEYPVSLYIFKRTDGSDKYTAYLPEYDFKTELNSFEDQDIASLLKAWEETHYSQTANKYAQYQIEIREPLKLEPAIVEKWTPKDYLKSTAKIVTDDIVTLDLPKGIDIELGFDPIPVNVMANGLHASMKTTNIAARFTRRWNTAQKRHIDIFREEMLVLDAFMNPKLKYDDIRLINEFFSYDTAVKHSAKFKEGLEKRKWFMEFQNTPFTQWIDENSDGKWKRVFESEDFKAKYPDIYNKWVDRFNQLASDPRYITYLPFINVNGNWIAHLFDFQKEDAIRIAMKTSVLYTAQMGLGKTRTSIVAALLKDKPHNLIVCEARFRAEWFREFAELGLSDPFEINYIDDMDEIENHQFCLCTYSTLKSAMKGKRPKRAGRKWRRNPPDYYNFDIKSPIERENEINNMAEYYNATENMAMLDLMEMGAPLKPNPRRKTKKFKTEEELNKTEQRIVEMRKRHMFVDNFIGRFEVAIVDEAHALSNPTTLQSEAIRRLSAKQWIFLTGTPIKNRVNGLLSVIVLGWGENNFANPYTKAEFLEHFQKYIKVEEHSVTADSHAYKKKKDVEIPIPAIENPDDLRTLMAGKWLRRVHQEPDVTSQITFPIPEIRIKRIEPCDEERIYAKQWYDEWIRLREEIKNALEEIATLQAQLEEGSLSESMKVHLERELKRLRTLIAISPTMINKLRFVALCPQVDPFESTPEDSALRTWVNVKNDYMGKGLTPQQQELFDEIVARVKKGEQCYTICYNPAFNRYFQPYLENEGIRTKIIDGDLGTGDRKTQAINDFREKKYDVLLCTINVFAVGINIPHASYCAIIQPDWNWADMNQAYSRMIRPQSKGTRTVDIFILNRSIVHYVHQLFEMKRVNLEYVLDYQPMPDEKAFVRPADMAAQMFEDMKEGKFSVT